MLFSPLELLFLYHLPRFYLFLNFSSNIISLGKYSQTLRLGQDLKYTYFYPVLTHLELKVSCLMVLVITRKKVLHGHGPWACCPQLHSYCQEQSFGHTLHSINVFLYDGRRKWKKKMLLESILESSWTLEFVFLFSIFLSRQLESHEEFVAVGWQKESRIHIRLCMLKALKVARQERSSPSGYF